jgi:Ethanolamine utilization protein EutJ (predicted chaperonin)
VKKEKKEKKDINWKTITTKDLAALIYQHLKNDDIDAILVGGSCVTIYSKNKYVSQDLDYASHSDNIEIKKSLVKLGFIHR